MNRSKLLVKLQPEFQRELFNRVIKEFGSSLKGSKFLKIPASSIRGYKNLYFDSISESLIDDLCSIKITNKKEIKKFTLEVISREIQRENNLSSGRVKRINYLKSIKNSIPSIRNIIKYQEINVGEWLKHYKQLLNMGFRQVSIKEDGEFIILEYDNFTKIGLRHFKKNIPKSITINNEFLYFLGLWCGDRSGGKRFGICNKNKGIIDFTENFLISYGQVVEKILYIEKTLPTPDISFDKRFLIDKDIKGWVLSVHSTNGVLSSFFHYLQSNLDYILERYNNFPFFAGLFDAEGNVSLYNKSFRWACKNEKNIKLYTEYLKKLRLYHRYDGGCLVSYNKEEFYDNILPYMKHNDKVNLVHLMCNGEGNLPKIYKDAIHFIKDNPYMTEKDISKALKKTKMYSELKMLTDFNYLQREGYPSKYKVTSIGLAKLEVTTS